MSVLTTGLISLLQLYISLSITVFIVHSYKYHVKEVSLKWSFCSEKTRKLLECVYNCIQHHDCRSLGYKNVSAQCYRHTVDTQNSSGTCLFGNLTELPSGGGKKMPYQTTQTSTQHERRTLLRVKLGWRKAREACRDKDIIRITNEMDQTTAVQIVNGSGLDFVAVGALRIGLDWVSTGLEDRLLYSDWAGEEPGALDFFAGLAKRSGYKWEGFPPYQRFDGVLCA